MRHRLRRLHLGLLTLLGPRPLGFYIPYRYAAGVRPAPYPALDTCFQAAEPAFGSLAAAITGHADVFDAIAAGSGPARFDQDWFAPLDAAAAYALVRSCRPARLVEIGSGHSTRFLARAVADGALSTAIHCVDPAPRASLAGLPVRHSARLFETADAAELTAGDILFVDSSHVAMPGTDVDRLFLDVLPRLPPGTLVHIHDIFLPDPYPEAWAWRGYNEQTVVGALLTGGAWEILWASHWVTTRRPDLATACLPASIPVLPTSLPSSLWLRRREAGSSAAAARPQGSRVTAPIPSAPAG